MIVPDLRRNAQARPPAWRALWLVPRLGHLLVNACLWYGSRAPWGVPAHDRFERLIAKAGPRWRLGHRDRRRQLVGYDLRRRDLV